MRRYALPASHGHENPGIVKNNEITVMEISIVSIFKLCSAHLIDLSLLPRQNVNDLPAMVKLQTVPPNR